MTVSAVGFPSTSLYRAKIQRRNSNLQENCTLKERACMKSLMLAARDIARFLESRDLLQRKTALNIVTNMLTCSTN